MQLYDIIKSSIGRDGIGYYCGMLRQPEYDKSNFINGKAFDITVDWKKEKSVISTFKWIAGAPQNWQVVARLNETVEFEEIEKVLQEVLKNV